MAYCSHSVIISIQPCMGGDNERRIREYLSTHPGKCDVCERKCLFYGSVLCGTKNLDENCKLSFDLRPLIFLQSSVFSTWIVETKLSSQRAIGKPIFLQVKLTIE